VDERVLIFGRSFLHSSIITSGTVAGQCFICLCRLLPCTGPQPPRCVLRRLERDGSAPNIVGCSARNSALPGLRCARNTEVHVQYAQRSRALAAVV
jgi:hypothetical protein